VFLLKTPGILLKLLHGETFLFEDIALPLEMKAHPFHSCQKKPLLCIFLPCLLSASSPVKEDQKKEEVEEEKKQSNFTSVKI